jgi:uncharacterized protein YqgC (DUF456 family)
MIGATIFELTVSRRSFKDSVKSGLGTVIGLFVSILLKSAVAVGIIVFVVGKVI